MKTLLKTAALAALIFTGTANAETVCDKCAYPPPLPPSYYFAGYLGGYWSGDLGTFNNLDIVQDYVPYGPNGNGTFVYFENFWIFDLNDTADVNVTITTNGLTDSGGGGEYAAELYFVGALAECVQGTERITCRIDDDDVGNWLAVDQKGKRLTLNAVDLVPGRYAVRLRASTSRRGSYTGQLSVR